MAYHLSEQAQNTNASSGSITLHQDYLKSIQGILKAVETVLYVIILICVGAGAHAWIHLRGVTICALICTILFYGVMATSVREQISVFIHIHWTALDFLSTGLHFMMMLIASIVAAAQTTRGIPADDAAIVFGLITAVVCFCHCCLGYTDFKSFVDRVQASRNGTTHHGTTLSVK